MLAPDTGPLTARREIDGRQLVNSRRLRVVFVVHRTTKFLDRAGGPTVGSVEPSTTALGDWYATVDLVDRTAWPRSSERRCKPCSAYRRGGHVVPGLGSWMPVHTARPPCPGRGRRRCHPEHCVGDRPHRIRDHAAAKAAGGRLAAALAIPGVRVAGIGLTSSTASRRTGAAMSPGQLRQPRPVLDPGGRSPLLWSISSATIPRRRGGRRDRTHRWSSSASGRSRDGWNSPRPRDAETAHPPVLSILGLKSSIRGR